MAENILVWNESSSRPTRSPKEVGNLVEGPPSSRDNAIVRYDGTTGKLIKDSSILVSNRTRTFTVNVGTDTISNTGHGFWNDSQLTFTSTGTLPGGLAAGTVYYVINRTDNSFQVSETVGGGPVDITSSGSGTHSAHTVGTNLTGFTVSTDGLSSDSLLLQVGMNSFAGYAGNVTLTGTNNTAFGVVAGRQLSTGSNNTLLGVLAGRLINTGGNNTCVGRDAGYSLNSQSNNVFVGRSAGRNSLTNNNVFVGEGAGQSSTSDNQVLIGVSAGRSGSGGDGNVFIGAYCGESAGGTGLIGVGQSALRYAGSGGVCQYNIGIGGFSLHSLVSGEYNAVLGIYSATSLKTASRNTAIGVQSGRFQNFSDTVSIGYLAYPTKDNQIVIGRSSFGECLFPNETIISTRRNATWQLQLVDALNLDGKYFILYTPIETTGVAFWFDITGSTTEPAHGAGRSIEVGTLIKKDFAPADVNTGTDTITITSHGFTNGTEVAFDSTGTLPGGLSSGVSYFVINSAANTFQVSETSGGGAVDITSQGSGTHSVADAINTVATKLATAIDVDSAFHAHVSAVEGREDGVFVRVDDDKGAATVPDGGTSGFVVVSGFLEGYEGSLNVDATEFQLLHTTTFKMFGETGGVITLDRPASISSHTWILPDTQGDVGTHLRNDGSGNLGWVRAEWVVSQHNSAYTAVHLDKILADTSGGSFTVTLPASPALGDTVMIMDGASSFGTNSLTVGRNGNNIAGSASDFVLSTNDAWAEFVYNGASRGWEIRT